MIAGTLFALVAGLPWGIVLLVAGVLIALRQRPVPSTAPQEEPTCPTS